MITLFASLGTPPTDNTGAILALLVFIAIVAGWVFLRRLVRSMQAGKTQSVVGSAFGDYAREALVNAAKIDEGAEFADIPHRPPHDHVRAQTCQGLAALLLPLLLKQHPAVDHDVAVFEVELDDPAAKLLADVGVELSGVPNP